MSTNLNAAFLIPAFCALAAFDPHYISNAVILYKSRLMFTTPLKYISGVFFLGVHTCVPVCVCPCPCVWGGVHVCVLAVGHMKTSGIPHQET